MLQNRRNALPFIMLITIAVACFGLWFLRTHFLYAVLDYRNIAPKDNVWDLTDIDFSKGFVRLTGQGETVPNALLSPEAFEARQNDVQSEGYKSAKALTMRMRILLPSEGMYAVTGKTIDYADKIYINGIHRLDVGEVGTDSASSKSYSASFVLEAFAESSAESGGAYLEIVRQSSNFHHQTMRNPAEIIIGKPEVIQRLLSLENGLTVFIMGMFFVLFLCHGMLHLIMKSYRANLYFALLCLTWCLRTGVTGSMPIPSWFPGMPWHVFLRMEYAFTGLAALFILFILGEFFSTVLPKWFKIFIIGYSVIFITISTFIPPMFLSLTRNPNSVVYISCIVFAAVRLVRALNHQHRLNKVRAEEYFMIASMLFLFLTAIHDVFYYTGYTTLGILNDLGFLIFSIITMGTNLIGTMREVERVHRTLQNVRTEAETITRASEMKEEFLHSLSHELQMPITVVSGFAQLTEQMLLDDSPDINAIADNMHRVDDEATRMMKMVSQLLDEAAMDNGSYKLNLSAFDICALINTAATVHFPLMDNNHNQIVLELPKRTVVVGDEERLLQVLLNLLSNAVKYTKDGTVLISVCRKENMARVSVADTGLGIHPSMIPDLFQRFSKHDGGGNGLGLYICRRIIETHGGKIGIDENSKQGAVVWFTVPLDKEY